MKNACPKCGFTPKPAKVGRPREFDHKEARKLKKKGYTLREIAEMLEVTHGAIAHSIKESNK